MQVKIDAGQKYRSALLETFNMRDITFLKRANWGGIVAETDRLYSTMFHDWDVLQKDCNDIEKAVKSLDWSIAPFVQKGEKVSPESEKVAQVVEEALWKQDNIAPGEFGHTFAQLLGVLTHAVWRGQNVHQIVWKSTGDLIYPARFEQLLPQYLQWEMQPGKVDRLLLVEDGEAAMPKPFPQYRFIVALNNSGPDHPLYNATYYSLVAWFAAFKKGLGWFMQFCERFGLPKPVIHYDNKEDKEELIAQLNDQRVINAILLEGDRSVEWATVPASGQSLPQRELLTMAEAACHKAILGQTLTSDTSQHGGSLAQAKVHAGVQADTVMRYAEYVADIINRQLIPAIVHFNFGRLDMPMPELRCKLPQAVANTERAQFWTQVLQIPGMRVNKSDIYDSLGIPMPSEGDDVIESPTAEENALQGLMQGFSKSKEKEPQQETDKGKKDEVALAARTEESRHESALKSWLAPLRQKLQEAKRAGASFDELKAMMLQAQLDTRALAGAFADNIKSGFLTEQEDELDAANPYGCNQYGEGWKMPHNGIQSTRDFRRKKGENKRDLPDTKKLDDTVVPDDDDSEEATKKRAERLNLHRDFAEEMRARLEEWKKQHTMHGSDVVKAAAGTEDDKRPFPVLMPDGSRCHTFGCERHQGADAQALKQTEKKLAELEAEMKKAYGKSDFEKLESLLNEHRAWLEYGEKCKALAEEAEDSVEKQVRSIRRKLQNSEEYNELQKRKPKKPSKDFMELYPSSVIRKKYRRGIATPDEIKQVETYNRLRAEYMEEKAIYEAWEAEVREFGLKMVELPEEQRGSTKFKFRNRVTKEEKAKAQQSLNELMRITSKNLAPEEIEVRRTEKERCYHLSGTVYLYKKHRVLSPAHEAVHALEYRNKELNERSIDFLLSRGGDEKLQKLKDLTGISDYEDDELAFEDSFAINGGSYYSGKAYPKTPSDFSSQEKIEAFNALSLEEKKEKIRTTDLLTMGVERVITDAAGFAREDPEYFEFVISSLRK